MNKRIMTVDELYLFCLQNNFAKFDSKETNSELVVEMPGLFEKSSNSADRHAEGMTPFVSRAFHDKINLNKSKINTNVFEDNLPSSHLRPILANIIRDEETNELDFGSHDFHIETVLEKDENGNEIEVEKVVYDEQPIGVIDGSRNTIEYDEKADVNRAVLHGYLYNDYCQDAIDILNRRGTVDCSIELSIRSLSFDANEKVLVLDDFYVSALTLLSAKTKPGMAGSNFKIEDFAIKDNSIKFNKDEKVIELLEKLDTLLSNFNIYQAEDSASENLKKGGNETVNRFDELLAKYGKTVEDITFEYENLSDEELEVQFAVVFTEDDTDGEGDADPESTSEGGEGEDNSNEDEVAENDDTNDDNVEDNNTEAATEVEEESNTEQFAEKLVRTYEISHDDIRYGLYNLLYVQEEADNEWYFINAVYDNHFTYENWTGDKIYGQSYVKDNDNVSFDGERWNLHRELLTDSEYAELVSMRSNYASLVQFKTDVENAELHAQREEILNNEKYSVLAEKDENNEYKNEAYAKLVSEMDNYSLAELEKELKSVFADYITSGGQFAYTGEPTTKPSVNKKLFTTSTSEKPSRYGNLFNKDKN